MAPNKNSPIFVSEQWAIIEVLVQIQKAVLVCIIYIIVFTTFKFNQPNHYIDLTLDRKNPVLVNERRPTIEVFVWIQKWHLACIIHSSLCTISNQVTTTKKWLRTEKCNGQTKPKPEGA